MIKKFFAILLMMVLVFGPAVISIMLVIYNIHGAGYPMFAYFITVPVTICLIEHEPFCDTL